MKLLARATSRTPIRAPQNRSSRSDSLAPAHGRAGGGQGPFPREGVGDGDTLQHETVSQSPGPPLKDPPTSPPHLWMGAPWGDDGGPNGARAAPSVFGRPAQRRSPGELSSGGSADGVTPSAATGAAFEPLRSLQGFTDPKASSGPASGMAGDRGDDLTGGTGPQRSGGIGPNASSSSGLAPAQREGNQTAIPGHGTGPLRSVLPAVPAWSAALRSTRVERALLRRTKGGEAPWLKRGRFLPWSRPPHPPR